MDVPECGGVGREAASFEGEGSAPSHTAWRKPSRSTWMHGSYEERSLSGGMARNSFLEKEVFERRLLVDGRDSPFRPELHHG